MTTTIRSLAAALALSALTPLAAHADAPSGEYYSVFAAAPTATQTSPAGREENRIYVEFTLDELVRASRGTMVTREEVRRALATMPQPPVGA